MNTEILKAIPLFVLFAFVIFVIIFGYIRLRPYRVLEQLKKAVKKPLADRTNIIRKCSPQTISKIIEIIEDETKEAEEYVENYPPQEGDDDDIYYKKITEVYKTYHSFLINYQKNL